MLRLALGVLVLSSAFLPAADASDNVRCPPPNGLDDVVCDALNVPHQSWADCFLVTAPVQWQAACVDPILERDLVTTLFVWAAGLPPCLFQQPPVEWMAACGPPPVYLTGLWNYLACYPMTAPNDWRACVL